MGHVNIFETKSKEELVKLYGEFLKVEETGFFDLDTDLDKIRKAYNEDFGSNTTWMLQIELTHAIADLWYEENKWISTFMEDNKNVRKVNYWQ